MMVPQPTKASIMRQGDDTAGILSVPCASGSDSSVRAECQPVWAAISSAAARAAASNGGQRACRPLAPPPLLLAAAGRC